MRSSPWPSCSRPAAGAPTQSGKSADAKSEQGKTAGIPVIQPERRDIRMTVIQPGTIQAFEVDADLFPDLRLRREVPVQHRRPRQGRATSCIDMWIPDLVEQHGQKSAAVKRAEVQIRVTQSALRAAEAKLETAKARIVSAEAGVKRAQASYTRWESEYKRLEILVNQRVLDVQVRDETYRQFEEAIAAATRPTRWSPRRTPRATRRPPTATGPGRRRGRPRRPGGRPGRRARGPRPGRVRPDQGPLRRRDHPAQRQPRRLPPARRRHEQAGPCSSSSRPTRSASSSASPSWPPSSSTRTTRPSSASRRSPGATREGKVVRSGFSLNPSTRTLQTEIDIPNADGHLHPGWYVTVTITIDRKQVWTLPSNAIGFQGQQNYYVYLEVDGKPVRTPVIIGPSDDTHTEVLKKYAPGVNTNDWPDFDGTEACLAGNLDVLAAGQPANTEGGQP